MDKITKIVEWLFNEHSYKFFNGTGFALIIASLALILIISCCVSKKIRKIFF